MPAADWRALTAGVSEQVPLPAVGVRRQPPAAEGSGAERRGRSPEELARGVNLPGRAALGLVTSPPPPAFSPVPSPEGVSAEDGRRAGRPARLPSPPSAGGERSC